MLALKVGKQGNSLGVTLTREATARLHVEAGDMLYLTEAPGGYRVTAYDPNFEHQMSVATRIMKRHRNALRELAKR
jgi:putative addiction module antidote